MRTVLFLSMFLLTSLACSRQEILEPRTWLQVRIEGDEVDLPWEELSASWKNGELVISAKGYQLKEFRMKLKHLTMPGVILVNSVEEMYFADGTGFQPDEVDAVVDILEAGSSDIRGRFTARFSDRQFNNQLLLTGSFGVH